MHLLGDDVIRREGLCACEFVLNLFRLSTCTCDRLRQHLWLRILQSVCDYSSSNQSKDA